MRSFYATYFGIELMLKLYKKTQLEVSIHIDELYSSLKSGLPRREAFGKYINRLEGLNRVKKIPHSQKKSMKLIKLTENIITELDEVFKR